MHRDEEILREHEILDTLVLLWCCRVLVFFPPTSGFLSKFVLFISREVETVLGDLLA